MWFVCDYVFIIQGIMVMPLSFLLSDIIVSTKRAAMNRMQSTYVKSSLVPICLLYFLRVYRYSRNAVLADNFVILLRIFARTTP